MTINNNKYLEIFIATDIYFQKENSIFKKHSPKLKKVIYLRLRMNHSGTLESNKIWQIIWIKSQKSIFYLIFKNNIWILIKININIYSQDNFIILF